MSTILQLTSKNSLLPSVVESMKMEKKIWWSFIYSIYINSTDMTFMCPIQTSIDNCVFYTGILLFSNFYTAEFTLQGMLFARITPLTFPLYKNLPQYRIQILYNLNTCLMSVHYVPCVAGRVTKNTKWRYKIPKC
jgi:hypothetical protein